MEYNPCNSHNLQANLQLMQPHLALYQTFILTSIHLKRFMKFLAPKHMHAKKTKFSAMHDNSTISHSISNLHAMNPRRKCNILAFNHTCNHPNCYQCVFRRITYLNRCSSYETCNSHAKGKGLEEEGEERGNFAWKLWIWVRAIPVRIPDRVVREVTSLKSIGP